jgi:hypothetical protein
MRDTPDTIGSYLAVVFLLGVAVTVFVLPLVMA